MGFLKKKKKKQAQGRPVFFELHKRGSRRLKARKRQNRGRAFMHSSRYSFRLLVRTAWSCRSTLVHKGSSQSGLCVR